MTTISKVSMFVSSGYQVFYFAPTLGKGSVDASLVTLMLVHSAAAYKQDIDDAIAAGANDHLVKSNGWPKLNETVARLLR